MARNINDTSITASGNKRDYLVLMDNTLVIGGEDKAHPSAYHECVAELTRKHAGANAALYGELGYILLMATCGNEISVHAMPIGGEQSQVLVHRFNVSGAR
jgi:hypothetical protein